MVARFSPQRFVEALLVHHEVYTSFSEMYLVLMTDNIFEMDTTALAHVANAPRESGILPTDFASLTLGSSMYWKKRIA